MECILGSVLDESFEMILERVQEEMGARSQGEKTLYEATLTMARTRPRRAHYRSPSRSATGHHGLTIRPPFTFHQQHNVNGTVSQPAAPSVAAAPAEWQDEPVLAREIPAGH